MTEALKIFGDAVKVTSQAGRTSSFEVTVNGKLVHSKLTMGHGKCNTDKEKTAVLAHVEQVLGEL